MVEQAPPVASHRSRTRLVVQGVLSLVLVVAIFYVLRRRIDPAQTWAAITAMTGPELTTLGNLACTDLEPQWLMAQSVPSASLVPCLGSLPAGWSVGLVTVNNGRSVIRLNHDRAGADALEVQLTAGCDTRGATEVMSNQPQVRRYQRIERQTPRFEAIHVDRFPGGCVIARAAIPAANRAEITSELTTIVHYTTRQALQQALDQRSDGRLQLTP